MLLELFFVLRATKTLRYPQTSFFQGIRSNVIIDAFTDSDKIRNHSVYKAMQCFLASTHLHPLWHKS